MIRVASDNLCAHILTPRLHRQMCFDERRQMSCLQRSWCSQASAKQRTGRAGRVAPGTALYLFTRQHYSSAMEPFDSSEMGRFGLESVILRVKTLDLEGLQVCYGARPSDYSCSFRTTPAPLPFFLLSAYILNAFCPSARLVLTPYYTWYLIKVGSVEAVLQQVVEPPELSRIGGAITSAEAGSAVTAFGSLAATLPRELPLCRLVFSGLACGCAAEAVVMAAGMSAAGRVQAANQKVHGWHPATPFTRA
jgi:HrpA-like RNA helicase